MAKGAPQRGGALNTSEFSGPQWWKQVDSGPWQSLGAAELAGVAGTKKPLTCRKTAKLAVPCFKLHTPARISAMSPQRVVQPGFC
jgi:hypothetical protein